MGSLWHFTRASLDDAYEAISERVNGLICGRPVALDEIIEQLKTAIESGQDLRSLIATEMPEASWENRAELEAILEHIEKNVVERRAVEAQRFRLLALAEELERGTIVHRLSTRVKQLNQLREQAISELRGKAKPDAVPEILPGPRPEEWLPWACALQDPDDTDHLEAIRNRFANLDLLVANLESDMWQSSHGAASSSSETHE